MLKLKLSLTINQIKFASNHERQTVRLEMIIHFFRMLRVFFSSKIRIEVFFFLWHHNDFSSVLFYFLFFFVQPVFVRSHWIFLIKRFWFVVFLCSGHQHFYHKKCQRVVRLLCNEYFWSAWNELHSSRYLVSFILFRGYVNCQIVTSYSMKQQEPKKNRTRCWPNRT